MLSDYHSSEDDDYNSSMEGPMQAQQSICMYEEWAAALNKGLSESDVA